MIKKATDTDGLRPMSPRKIKNEEENWNNFCMAKERDKGQQANN